MLTCAEDDKGIKRDFSLIYLIGDRRSGYSIPSKDSKNTEPKIFLGSFKASVSTGTYIRGIVNDLGNTLGIGACALSIKRTKLGEYTVKDSLA